MKDKISDRIKEIRAEYKLSQEELGKKISVSQDTISLWENDKALPSTEYVIAICKLFSVSADYLLCLVD
ncbi:MAG: helix-turn-helix transcriptional regulator [Clostridiales bacterium]|nr:helix-turn-helix transcriptional regulator [Clostridiales bacterium]